MELAAISKKIYAAPNTDCVAIKRNLFNSHITNISFKSISENEMNDKQDEFGP